MFKEEDKITDYCRSCGHFSCKCDKEYCPNYTTPEKMRHDAENMLKRKTGKHTKPLNIIIK